MGNASPPLTRIRSRRTRRPIIGLSFRPGDIVCIRIATIRGTPPNKPPGGGYGLAPDAMQELAAMLNKNTPVTIE